MPVRLRQRASAQVCQPPEGCRRRPHPLPYADHQWPDGENPDALIPVERVCGPVLLIAAGADQVWPSAQMARALSARLDQHGDPHGHTLLDYPAPVTPWAT